MFEINLASRSQAWLCTSVIQLRALIVRFASVHTKVQYSLQHRGQSNCVICQRAIHVSGPYDSAWWTEGLRNVNIVLTLPQHQQIVSYTTRAGPSRPTASRNCSSGTYPPIRLNKGSFDVLATRFRSHRSSTHSILVSSLDRFTTVPSALLRHSR